MKKILFFLLLLTLITSGCSNLKEVAKTSVEVDKGLTIHFKQPSTWPNEIYIYYYLDENTRVGEWPGIPMVYEDNDWYVYTITESWYKESKIMFFGDDGHRNPQHMEPGFEVWKISESNEMWFYRNKWYNQNPEGN